MGLPTVRMICELVGGESKIDPAMEIRSVRSLEAADPNDLSFLGRGVNVNRAGSSRAGAILVDRSLDGDDSRWIKVDEPGYALARVLQEWFVTDYAPAGRSDLASVAASADIGRGARIGAWVRIGEDAVIGEDVVIHERCSVGRGSAVGAGSVLHPGVTIYPGVTIGQKCVIHSGAVIGADGFGFVTHQGTHHKIPQIGGVIIGNDVEIGANTTIDRGALEDTVVGDGTKIDNLVMIAHNVKVGKHCFLAAEVGIAGSTEIGDYCAFGGRAGAYGHLKIGSRVQVAAVSVVTRDVDGPVTLSGTPARPLREYLRKEALTWRLTSLFDRVRKLEGGGESD